MPSLETTTFLNSISVAYAWIISATIFGLTRIHFPQLLCSCNRNCEPESSFVPATMATGTEASEENPNNGHGVQAKTLDLGDATPWIEYAVQQAQLLRKTVEENVDSTLQASRSRLSEIRSTSSAHFHQTIDTLQDLKSKYATYEDAFFGKIKEGIVVASSHPAITGGVAASLGFLVLKKPWRFLYYNTMRFLVSEESMLSKADTKVKELRRSLDLLKAESEKLEKRASFAEQEWMRGRTKLRQAGKQIRGVIRSAYKIERQAGGLKDVLKELPSREAWRFQSQVSNLVSEAKRERNALTKEVSKISNHGISV